MSQKLVTATSLAEELQLNRGRITEAKRGPIKNAVVGKRIDRNHKDVIKFVAERRADLKRQPKYAVTDDFVSLQEDERDQEADDMPPGHPSSIAFRDDINDDISQYADMTLADLIEKFGTETAFKDWLDARKKIEEIREKQLKNRDKQGDFLLKSTVKLVVFASLEKFTVGIVGDGAKAIAQELKQLYSSGATIEEGEQLASKVLSTHLRGAKKKIKDFIQKQKGSA